MQAERGHGTESDDLVDSPPIVDTHLVPSSTDVASSGNGSGKAWYRRWRWVGFVILALATVYGVREAIMGDREAVLLFWRSKLAVLPLILGLATFDIAMEGVAWVWVFKRFGLRAPGSVGVRVYLAGNAGLLLPAQLGRLIRPEAMVRMGRGSLVECGKAEGTVFVLDAISVVALLAALGAWRIHPALMPVAGIAVIAVCLYLGNRLANRLSDTRLGLPDGFWWHWKSAAVVMVEMAGWIAHGVAFYILVSQLSGNVSIWSALFFAPASAVAGVSSGLPGGIGATETLLGAFLRFSDVSAAHLALTIGAFRVVTFWIWIPIGWAALAMTRKWSLDPHLRPGHAEFRAGKPIDVALSRGSAPTE